MNYRITPHPLRAKLALVGLSQVEVAAKVPTHRSTLNAQLRGFAEMSPETETAIRQLIRDKVRQIVRTFPEEVAHAS